MRISDWSSDVCSSDLILLVDKLAKIDKLQSNVIGRHFGARGGTRMDYAVERWEGGPERLVLVHGSLSAGAGAFSEQESLARRFTVARSEERRGGTACGITVRFRWWADYKKKSTI